MILHKRFLSPLALVVFVTLFHSGFSRHKIRHQKDRFKRQQGANLYLPGSYINDGGDSPYSPDSGPWSDWSQPSPCSRTCGGGVSTVHRQCAEGYSCTGPSMRHFSCNTQDCPDNADFRSQQCAQYDEQPFEGNRYHWIPYTKGTNPCELNCMPRGERFYYRHKAAVEDGTRCHDEGLDVCVQGKCQAVGCDMMLGSNAREDSCRHCGGDGSNCRQINGTLDMQDLQVGYNDILLIPRGATNINVEEVEPTNNYIAIRNTTGHFYLNGNWMIDFPRTLEFAGCKFHYERSPQGFAAPDKVYCLGPITEALFIVLLYQDNNTGVKYSYSVPSEVEPGSELETYAWTFDAFKDCSASCGGGIQYRNVTCAGRKTLEPVEENLCDGYSKPDSSRKCNEIPCDPQWVPHPWTNCSAPCGADGGYQTRQVSCQQIVSNGYPSLVSDELCKHLPKPPLQQECNRGTICAKWHIGPWKPCDHLCGDGKQTRKVKCFVKDDKNKIKVLPDSDCTSEPKPATEQKCNARPCEGVDWITSEWSGCDICGLKNETRKVQCATASGQIFSDDLCEKDQKPETVRECDVSNTTCEFLWYASQWSDCSVKCGEGVQTRTLFCGTVTKDGVKQVEVDKCDKGRNFELIRSCKGEKETCDEGEWYSGPWGECSKPCGGGERTKKVICLVNNEVVDASQCSMDKIVFSSEPCNTQACSDDKIIPTDITQHVDESDTTVAKTTKAAAKKTTALPKSTTESSTGQTKVESSDKTTESTDKFTESSEKTTEPSATSESSDKTTESSDKTTSTGTDKSESTKESTEESGKTTISKEESEATTEPTEETTKSSEDEDEEYEIVPDDECEDGEWVDEEDDYVDSTKPQGDDDMATDLTTETSESGATTESGEPTESGATTESGGTSEFSMDNLMLSDGTTTSDQESEASSSGDEGITESSMATSEKESESTVEGSGDTSETSSGTTSSDTTAESGATDKPYDSKLDYEELGTDSTTSQGSTDGVTESDMSSTSEDSTSDSTTETPTETTSDTAETSESTSESATETATETATESGTESSSGDMSSTLAVTESSDSSTEGGTGTTEEAMSGSTVESTESDSTKETETTESEGSTESTVEYTGTTETVTTGETESTVEFTGTTESEASSESPASTVESSGLTTEFDIWSSTTVSGSTESSDLWETSSVTDMFTMKPRMCKRRKLKDCKKSKYGCCWDNISEAKGPFDQGCPAPKTCKEAKFGCCEDGVSAALGPKFRGCPSTHCNETLFGCCPDKKTPAEGDNSEGCPPPPPKCLKSRWGCCKDNVTAAKGPKQKGCKPDKKKPDKSKVNCALSKFGCCPDGVSVADGEYFKGCDIVDKKNCTKSYFGCCPDKKSSATGPNFRGCKVPCSNSTFGCCSDGTTPAHGYSGEGCCLATPYGCCPDNIMPARGANQEGCGCQYSPYGCCPDNKTPARGHNNEGCGCQFTPHGCCPDSFTPAGGPNYEGCLCHTYQFGCCPDGLSIAKGPHQQGCGCRNSEFGCCSDEETPAAGPNMQGCGCDTTKYGCCLDGVTEAKGENFEGCTDIPVNHQDSCSLPKERGSCRNYTVKWYYDMDYGGCSRFWYGGCDGNDNRFKSKEECDGICTNPTGPDRCNLPKVSGPCEGYYPQWYYDKNSQHCAQFIYGGCLGNNNRFETVQECNALCVRDNRADACEQPKEEGPCHGQYRRYFYDKSSGQCQQFVYGGCKGNNNNFPTADACKQKCAAPGRKKDHCNLPRAQGNCTSKEPRWYYDTPEKRCMPFYYSGCNGNDNNFISREACQADCPTEVEKDLCYLPAEVGECGNYVFRWYYDTKDKQCREFYYGGCGGNGNNFRTEDECKQRCPPVEQSTPAPPQPPERPPSQPETQSPESFREEFCFLQKDIGPCRNGSLRYFYDRTDGVCKSFTYGGCEGNGNRFTSLEECMQKCGYAQDLCTLPMVVGPCDSEYDQFFYDQRDDTCKPFKFGGCSGNYNRFNDKESCEQRCKRRREPVATQAPPEPASDMCYQYPDPGNCTENYSAFFFNSTTNQCTPFTYTGCGGNANRFNSEEQCQRQCGEFRGQDVCNQDRDPGPCRAYFIKYYYDRNSGRCGQFAYGGCRGNGNRFSSNEECESICMTHQESKPNITSSAICTLPVDKGSCQDGYHKRWYFDNERGECVAFIYTGCGGNFNNFKSFSDCINNCRDYYRPTEAPGVTQPPNARPDEHCDQYANECPSMRCPYGVLAYIDENQCNRCECNNPCKEVSCPPEHQCAIDLNYNRTSEDDPNYIAVCREINKPGICRPLESSSRNCEQECRNDADCTLNYKCCTTGCGTACVEPIGAVPAELVTQPGYTNEPASYGYQPPQVDVQTFEPEVDGLLGDYAVLKCAVTGNPTPRITWRKGNIEFDGTQARYRVRLDQSLQIITLHKTDSGIYLCTANNSVGDPITNQIKLEVMDSPQRPVTILDPEDPREKDVIVSLNAPTTLNCFALGSPLPSVTWWRDDSMVPLNNNEYTVRKDYSLLIHSVQLQNLGIYTCQAYNGVGKAASWAVTVRAKGPYYTNDPNDQKYLQYIVNQPEEPQFPYRPNVVLTTAPESYYNPYENNYDPNEIIPQPQQAERPSPEEFTVPVRTMIPLPEKKFPTGGDVSIPCDVEGFPLPQVQWYKDGVPISPSDRINITENHRLIIQQASGADSGSYTCEARNDREQSSSSVTIQVQGMYISPTCQDNRHLANCKLIVQAKFCMHRYYAKFCCRSCTEAGQLPSEDNSKSYALENNLV